MDLDEFSAKYMQSTRRTLTGIPNNQLHACSLSVHPRWVGAENLITGRNVEEGDVSQVAGTGLCVVLSREAPGLRLTQVQALLDVVYVLQVLVVTSDVVGLVR